VGIGKILSDTAIRPVGVEVDNIRRFQHTMPSSPVCRRC